MKIKTEQDFRNGNLRMEIKCFHVFKCEITNDFCIVSNIRELF